MFESVDNEEIKGIDDDLKEDELVKTGFAAKLPRGYLSISQVTQFKKCGEAYNRRYVLEEGIARNSFMVQGRGVHKAAEHLHLAMIDDRTMSPEEMTQIYSDLHDEEIVDATIDPDEGTSGHVKDTGIKLTKKYHRVANGMEVDAKTGYILPPVQPLAAERLFNVEIKLPHLDPIPFKGVIDLEEAEGISDLKTKKKASPQAEADDSIQLSLYAHVTGKAQVRLDQLVKPTKTLPERFLRLQSIRSKKEVAHALDIVGEVAEDIVAGRFRKTNPESWWCTEKWCPYWKTCRGRNR